EVEGRRILHGRIVDGRQRQLLDVLLGQDEAPELTGKEVVAVAEGPRVGRLAANKWRTLERILANVDQGGHIRRGLFTWPAPRLLEEGELEVVDADCAQLRAAEVEQLVAL